MFKKSTLYNSLCLGFVSLMAVNHAQAAASAPVVSKSVNNVTIPALRDIALNLSKDTKARLVRGKMDSASGETTRKTSEIIQNFELPFVGGMGKSASGLSKSSKTMGVLALDAADPVQRDFLGDSMPSPLMSFDGIDNINRVAPPDTTGDVGPNHYVQMVNVSFAIWDKQGNQLIPPTPTNAIWKSLGGICAQNNDGDPIVLYDPLADRWMMSQFAINQSDYHECVAVSKTPDPTGEWHLYDFKISDIKMNDYPHFGVWPDGYYMSVNQFYLDGREDQWGGAGAVVFEREKMLRGEPARMVYFDDPAPELGGMLPADLDGLTPPPEGAPNYFVQPIDDSQGPATDELHIWAFKTDWQNPEQSTFEQIAMLPVTGMEFSGCKGGCIPQPDVSSEDYLDRIPYRLMFRLAYRNFGDHEAMVLNHTVFTGDADTNRWSPRWYEIRNPSTTPTVHQQSSYAPDGDTRWMGSVAMDAVGNIALGYTVSGPNTYPSVRYTGRLASDPLNTMPQGENELVAGGSSQRGANGRWGDYSTMSVDPVDDCTFWYTQEYYGDLNAGDIDWMTRIGSFKFPNCTTGPQGTLVGTVTGVEGKPLANAMVKAGAVTAFTDENGHYEVTMPVGSYDVSVRAYGYQEAKHADLAIAEDSEQTLSDSLSPLPLVTLTGKVVDNSGHGWPLAAKLALAGELAPNLELMNDPATGEFSVEVYQGWGYKITASTALNGYNEKWLDFVASDTQIANGVTLALDVNNSVCSAPGYKAYGIVEDFDGETFPPAGWTVVNDATGDDIEWRTNTAWDRPNFTGGSGKSAAVDNDRYGWGKYDTSLVSPSIQVSALEDSTALQFKLDFVGGIFGGSMVDLDISVDGGAWKTLLSYPDTTRERLVDYDLAAEVAGATEFRLRWHYHHIYGDTKQWDNWAQVDDISIARGCSSVEGGLVAGTITDFNTQLPVANVEIVDGLGNKAVSDHQGQYVIFSAEGEQQINLHQAGYADVNENVSVTADDVTAKDFSVKAGRLSSETETIELAVTSGRNLSETFEIQNSGSNDLTFKLGEINAPLAAPVEGPKLAIGGRKFGPKNLWDLTTRKIRVPYILPQADLEESQVVQSWAVDLVASNGVVFDQSTGDLWINNLGVFGGDDKVYRFKQDGTKTEDKIDLHPLMTTRGAHAGMTYNSRTGKLWQIMVGGERCIYELDPVEKQATGKRLCPDVTTSQRGLAYDAVNDQFFSGSFIDGLIHRFGSDGTLLESTDVGLPIAGLAFNPTSQHLFVATNSFKPMDIDIYILDVANDYQVIGGYAIDGRADGGGSGLTIDCQGHLWALDIEAQQLFEVDSGETGVCDFQDVNWLSLQPNVGDLSVAGNQQVTLDVDAANMAPGEYEVQVLLNSNSPYKMQSIPVKLTVNERVPGVLGFAVTHYEANEADGTVTLTVSRQGGSDNALTLEYRTLDATAKAGEDFEAAWGVIKWDDMDMADKTISIKLLSDDVEESMESFSVALSQPTGGATLNSATIATVELEDKKSSGGSLGPVLLLLLGVGSLFSRRQARRS
ncbi:Calx-beta domain-containing protein [Shewanella aegiceratis]|uniref:Calx-beta domain-containing protein n=1 Tax=Shewanella aegiceratis TaxID=2864203 RepID=UPI001C65992F|nr:Calx-beta domain-containing protein [Shewanella aegiceratis]QYJ81891.1 carboxypeptidase regulatory-like domain-containing protein [Shewanella aegiceratis]